MCWRGFLLRKPVNILGPLTFPGLSPSAIHKFQNKAGLMSFLQTEWLVPTYTGKTHLSCFLWPPECQLPGQEFQPQYKIINKDISTAAFGCLHNQSLLSRSSTVCVWRTTLLSGITVIVSLTLCALIPELLAGMKSEGNNNVFRLCFTQHTPQTALFRLLHSAFIFIILL